MTEQVSYPGKDLEAMSFAVNYHRWIFESFRPYLGKSLVEVGAGTGSFSVLLLEGAPAKLTLVEPSEMFEQLVKNIGPNGTKTNITFINSIFTSSLSEIATSEPDTILYVNVLEHIEDDETELRAIHSVLGANGICLIFVPAFEWLYGPFDRRVGHFRRYSKRELVEKCESAGFRVLKATYFDALGVLPWWIKYRLLRSDSLDARAVDLYDKYAVPVTSFLEGIAPVPFGKNVLLAVKKP